MTYPRNKMVKKMRKWDKITKKYNNYNNGNGFNGIQKSDAIKKLIEKNFIGINELKNLSGEYDNVCVLNPAVVMDMRHSMVCSILFLFN